MTWRDLKPWLDDWTEPERPYFAETAHEPGYGGVVTCTFADEQSRAWYAAWLESKAGWTAFMAWLDARR